MDLLFELLARLLGHAAFLGKPPEPGDLLRQLVVVAELSLDRL